MISSLSVSVDENTATLEARIRPGGLDAVYEFWLRETSCAGGACSGTAVASGHVAAGHLEEAVSAVVSSLNWNSAYAFAVTASNTAGSRSSEEVGFETSSPPPGGAGGGTGAGPPFESPEDPWNIEGARKSAEEATKLEAERQAKKREEEERSAAVSSPAAAAACLVPELKGDSLAAARAALRSKKCRLGAITRPARSDGNLVVVHQQRVRGTVLPADAAVAIRLGERHPKHPG